MSGSVYFGEWQNPMVCTMTGPEPVPNNHGDSPWTQGTYVLDAVSKVSGNNSQQYRFVITTTTGQVLYTAWYLITDANFRYERLASNIDTANVYFNYIESDIYVEFRNTAGPVYMNSFYISRDDLQPASVPTQVYCAVQMSYPNDGALCAVQTTYTASRPAGYIAEIGMHLGRLSNVTLLDDSSMEFFLRAPSLSTVTYPNATWQVYLYKKNSTLANMSLIKVTDFTPGSNLIDFLGVTSWGLIRGNNYIMRIYALNNGVIVQQPFQDINITVYFGMALQATRIGGNRGISPQLTAIGQANGVFEVLCSNFYSPKEGFPLNDTSSFSEYIEIKLSCVAIDIPPDLRLTVWGNQNNPGYVCFVDSAAVFNTGTIYFKTRGRQQYSTQFSTSMIKTYFEGPSQLTFNITYGDQEENNKVCEAFTSKRITLDMVSLINQAITQQNEWLTSSSYVIEASKTVESNTRTLRFQLYVRNYNFIPPVPPTPVKDDTIMFVVEEKAVESIQESIYNENRPSRLIVHSHNLQQKHFQQALDSAEDRIFQGNAAVELYNLANQIDPKLLYKVNTVGELIDEIQKANKNWLWGNKLDDHWLFGNEENLNRLVRTQDIAYFMDGKESKHRRTRTDPFYVDAKKGQEKVSLKKRITVQEAVFNYMHDKRFGKLFGYEFNPIHAELYGTGYNPFNATDGKIYAGRWNHDYGPLEWRDQPFRPLEYKVSPFDPEATFELTDQQFDQLSIAPGWFTGSNIGIGKLAAKLGASYSETAAFLASSWKELLASMAIPGVYWFGKQMTSNSQALVPYNPAQTSFLGKLWSVLRNVAYYAPVIKSVADSFRLTQLIQSSFARFMYGPGAMETIYTTLSGDSEVSLKNKVMLQAVEDTFLGPQTQYISLGSALMRSILPADILQYAPNEDMQNTILKVGAVLGMITNPQIQMGFVTTGLVAAAYKSQSDSQRIAQEIDMNVSKAVETVNKIVITGGDEFMNMAEKQQKQIISQQRMFQSTLKQIAQQTQNDFQTFVDQRRYQLDQDLGYAQSQAAQFNREFYNMLTKDSIIQQFDREAKKKSEEIAKVVQDNNLIPIGLAASMLLGTAAISFAVYSYNENIAKERRELERQQEERRVQRRREEFEQNKKKTSQTKEQQAAEGKIKREIDQLHLEQKTAFEGKRERIKQFKEMIRRTQELSDIQNKVSVSSLPYSYISNTELIAVPHEVKLSVVAQLINHSENNGGTPEETLVLSNNSAVNTVEKQQLYIHAIGNLITNMPTLFDTYDGNQTAIVIDALGQYLKDQMWFSKARNDIGAYITTKVMKALVQPEDQQEYEIRENIARFTHTRRSIDVKEAIQDARKCKIEDIFYYVQDQEKINNLVSDVIATTSSTSISFNGTMYVNQRHANSYKPKVLPAVAPGWHYRHRKNGYRRKGFVEFKPIKLGRLKREGDEANLLYDFYKRKLN